MELTENSIKKRFIDYLKEKGFEIDKAITDKLHGPDIKTKFNESIGGCYIIECKGLPMGISNAQYENYFLNSLGQILLRMDRKENKFGLVFPDHPLFRRKLKKLGAYALEQLNLDFFFVNEKGAISKIDSQEIIKNKTEEKANVDIQMNFKFEEFWEKLTDALRTETLIKNWTVKKGHTGKDFHAIYKEEGCISIDAQISNPNIPRKEFEIIFNYWTLYNQGKIGRSDLVHGRIAKCFFTKYTISILHQLEYLMKGE